MSRLLDTTRVYFPGRDGDPDFEVACMWFAKCDCPANGVGDAGPLGHLPLCRRCAEQVGMTEFIAGGVD